MIDDIRRQGESTDRRGRYEECSYEPDGNGVRAAEQPVHSFGGSALASALVGLRNEEPFELLVEARDPALDRLKLSSDREHEGAPVFPQRLLICALLRQHAARPPGRGMRKEHAARVRQREGELDVAAIHRKLDRSRRVRFDKSEIAGAITPEYSLELVARPVYAHPSAGPV